MDIIYETEDVEEFFSIFTGLGIAGVGSEPEPSIGAVIRAIEVSEPGSPIFVFTDSSPSDHHRISEAVSLVMRKNIPVSFALTISHHRVHFSSCDSQKVGNLNACSRRSLKHPVYEHLVALSGGQVLNMEVKEIPRLATLVSFSAVHYCCTILQKSDILFGSVTLSVPIDSSVLQATISISVFHLKVSVYSPQG